MPAGVERRGTPLLFCAHLDTVLLAGTLAPYVGEDGVVRNAGGTILGADDKAAVAVMLEAARRIVADGLPHPGVELLFTPMEEVGLQGARAFDIDRLGAKVGFVYDQAAPIGEIVLGAPYARTRSRHVSCEPAAYRDVPGGRTLRDPQSRAIADLRLGRVDELSSATVGLIAGGTARNVVPDFASSRPQARSHDPERLAAARWRCWRRSGTPPQSRLQRRDQRQRPVRRLSLPLGRPRRQHRAGRPSCRRRARETPAGAKPTPTC